VTDEVLYSGNPPSWCNADDSLAVVQDELRTVTMTICPRTFTSVRAGSSQTIEESLKQENIQKANTLLDEVAPRSITFLHELFHLIIGNEETPDEACKY
jgi:hypothetical protein